MNKIFVVIEKSNPFGKERIACSFTDENVAKKYCRDMRTDGELYYEAVSLNPCTIQDISAKKIYKVMYRTDWHYREDIPATAVCSELLSEKPIAKVVNENFFSISQGSLRAVCLENNDDGTSFSFWCYAKNAPEAIKIAKETLSNFDPSILKWGHYFPLKKDDRELTKRIEQYYKKTKK